MKDNVDVYISIYTDDLYLAVFLFTKMEGIASLRYLEVKDGDRILYRIEYLKNFLDIFIDYYRSYILGEGLIKMSDVKETIELMQEDGGINVGKIS